MHNFNPDDYELISGIGVSGGNGHFDIKVLLQTNAKVDLRDVDLRMDILKHTDAMLKEIMANAISLNPESKAKAMSDCEKLLECFETQIFVEEIPNGYCKDYCCRHLPWFIVTTPIGRFKIGWRKSVIHLEWTETTCKKEAKEIFPDEDVTRYDKVIHAWGYDKAKEYIDKVFASVP
jgi:hypothetical protein